MKDLALILLIFWYDATLHMADETFCFKAMPFNHFHQDLKFIGKLEKSFLLRLILCGSGVVFLTWLWVLIEFGRTSTFSQELYGWAGLTLTTPILYYAMLPLWRSFFSSRAPYLTTDIPLLITLLTCYGYSIYVTLAYTEHHYVYFDSILMILFIVYTSRYMEIFSRRRVARLSQNLHSLPSKRVKVIKADQQFHEVDLKEIVIKDKLYIAPGEYIPVDGIICDGDTSVDESMLTGEALAIPKFSHDLVRAGTCNLDKAVTIEATSTFEQSYLGKTLSSVKGAQLYKYEESLPNDQLGLWHQMFAFSIAFAVFCWWVPFNSQFALLCLVSTLLITCPCALAIAYPLTISSALETCLKMGILVKNPAAFLKFGAVQHVLFDKTGTLTEGNLIVAEVEFFNNAKKEEVLPLIAVVERNTHHPIAHAIADYAEKIVGSLPTTEISRLRVFPGKGVRALVNGQFILIGSGQWLKKNGVFIAAEVIVEQENKLQSSNFVFVHCAIGGVEVARIQLKDKVRDEAQSLIAYLKAQDLDLTILSGDHPAIVNAVAKQIGPISVAAQALPQKKEAQVACLQDQGKITAMVGDGLNDALALRQADIGIAIGTGNAISIFCADIILQKPHLSLIASCLELSRQARTILKQNYAIAFCFNLMLLPFAALGQLSPLIILISLSLSSLIIMANSARLKFKTRRM